jgi:predicted Fe-Mo cluster-binding NifX family protein
MGQKHLVAKNEAVRTGGMKRVKKRAVPDREACKILIPLLGDDIAPRFDLAPEAFIATIRPDGEVTEERTIILSEASAEALCHLILAEKIDTVICCGIEDEYFQYLTWKQVKVIDSVIGPYVIILDKMKKNTVSSGDILLDRNPVRPARP